MISRGLRAAVATAALVFISRYPVYMWTLERYGRSTGAELEAVNEYRIHPERGASYRLPDREGDYHSRSVSPVVECPDQCLQPENQPRTGARLERGRSPAVGGFADEKIHGQRQIRRLRRARHEVQAPLLQYGVRLLE